MFISALFAFLHFAAVFVIFATVFYEWLTMSPAPTLAEARRLQLCDRWYGIGAGVVLVVGVLRVLYFEKGTEFYAASPFFRAKLLLFLIAGLLSIYPTVRFIKWRAATRQGLAPQVSEQEHARIMLVLRLELVLLLGVTLCASLMARAVGV
jgi:putative membrane protein